MLAYLKPVLFRSFLMYFKLKSAFDHIYVFTLLCTLNFFIPIMQSISRHQLDNCIAIYNKNHISCFHSILIINFVYFTSLLLWIIILAVTLFVQCSSNHVNIRTEEDKIYGNINDCNLEKKCFLLSFYSFQKCQCHYCSFIWSSFS